MALTLEQLDGAGPVYGPDGGAGLPGVIIVHGAEGPGAGWSHRFAAILAAHGFLAVPVSYGEGDIFGAGPILDVDISSVPAAGRALAAHARCSGRVGLFGWSKGGELSMILVTRSPAPFACIAVHAAPATITGAFVPGAPLSRSKDAPRAWIWDGNDDYLAPGTALAFTARPVPLFFSSGTADEVIPHAETLELAERARVAGAEVEVFISEGQGHGLDFDVEPRLWVRLTGFLRKHLEG